jgi:hypothetical protein
MKQAEHQVAVRSTCEGMQLNLLLQKSTQQGPCASEMHFIPEV